MQNTIQQSPSSPSRSTGARWYALFVATLGMAATFAIWGALAPIASLFQKDLNLTNTQISILIAIPVLLGSVMRIPLGMLTDRYGGKKIFLILLVFTLLPTFVLGTVVNSYRDLVLWAFVLGMAGTSFAVGVPFVSKWFPPEKQGIALGVFGMGNGGTAIASFFAPKIAQEGNWHQVFLWFSIPILILIILFLFAKDAPSSTGQNKSFADIGRILASSPIVWILSFFYFITFGGFVSFSNYIPKLMVDLYGLPRTTVGSITAFFVIMATVGRPLGGWLSDRIGGRTILKFVFIFIGLIGLLLTLGLPLQIFSPVIWGLGFIAGVGNGAVFKLVPQYFAKDTGIATGIVGAAGGLGGFFPPLFLGYFRDTFGGYTPGFILLILFTLVSILIDLFLLNRISKDKT